MALSTTAATLLTIGAGILGGSAVYGANRQYVASKSQASAAKDAAKAQKQAAQADADRAAALAQAPEIAAAKAKEGIKRRRTAASRSQSVRTDPLGVGGQADIARKSLLGL